MSFKTTALKMIQVALDTAEANKAERQQEQAERAAEWADRPPPPPQAPLSTDDVKDFKTAARQRTPNQIMQLDAFASELRFGAPTRSRRFRKDLKWVLKNAELRGIEWD